MSEIKDKQIAIFSISLLSCLYSKLIFNLWNKKNAQFKIKSSIWCNSNCFYKLVDFKQKIENSNFANVTNSLGSHIKFSIIKLSCLTSKQYAIYRYIMLYIHNSFFLSLRFSKLERLFWWQAGCISNQFKWKLFFNLIKDKDEKNIANKLTVALSNDTSILFSIWN